MEPQKTSQINLGLYQGLTLSQYLFTLVLDVLTLVLDVLTTHIQELVSRCIKRDSNVNSLSVDMIYDMTQ